MVLSKVSYYFQPIIFSSKVYGLRSKFYSARLGVAPQFFYKFIIQHSAFSITYCLIPILFQYPIANDGH